MFRISSNDSKKFPSGVLIEIFPTFSKKGFPSPIGLLIFMSINNSAGKNDISVAEWTLVDEIRAGKWKNLDFPRIAREEIKKGISLLKKFLIDQAIIHQ
jgi:hypothetical protein